MRFLKKTKNRTTWWSSDPTSGCKSKGNKVILSKRHLHSMIIAALVTPAKSWEQPRCPSTDEWIKQMRCNTRRRLLLCHQKGWALVLCNHMDGTGDHYFKWIGPSTEDKYHVLSLSCGILKSCCHSSWGYSGYQRLGQGDVEERLITKLLLRGIKWFWCSVARWLMIVYSVFIWKEQKVKEKTLNVFAIEKW